MIIRVSQCMIVYKYVQFERTFDMKWRFETFTAGYVDFRPRLLTQSSWERWRAVPLTTWSLCKRFSWNLVRVPNPKMPDPKVAWQGPLDDVVCNVPGHVLKRSSRGRKTLNRTLQSIDRIRGVVKSHVKLARTLSPNCYDNLSSRLRNLPEVTPLTWLKWASALPASKCPLL